MVAVGGSDVAIEELFVGSGATSARITGWEEARGGWGLESHYCEVRVKVTDVERFFVTIDDILF